MKTAKKIMVAVSALALRAFMPGSAGAQVQISCPANLNFARFFTCGIGTLAITVNGGTNKNGCIAIKSMAFPAQCILNTGGVPITKSVKVQFTAKFINITNAGNKARINNFEMFTAGASKATTTMKFSPTAVKNTVTIDVGATLEFNGAQSTGSYVGSINVTAN